MTAQLHDAFQRYERYVLAAVAVVVIGLLLRWRLKRRSGAIRSST